MQRLPEGNERILVVDDDKEIRSSVSRVLERLGYRVHTAEDPEEALDVARSHRIQLVVGDVILPLMSGLTLAHRISSVRPGVRVLYMSGYTTEEALGDQSLPRGTVDFIQKPFAVSALARKVRELLDRPVSEETERPRRTVPDEDPTLQGDEAVLVVDDDPDVRRSISRVLDRLGYQVFAAEAPDEALRIALTEEVDLLVSDVVMPRLNGLALAHTLSSLRPRMKALYMSGYERDELEGLDEGAMLTEPDVRFLQKPFTPEELGEAARAILDGTPGEG